MARTVDDCALLLSAIAGPDARSPISIDEPGDQFFPITPLDTKHVRVAFSPDFDGQFPFQSEVISATKSAEAMLLKQAAKSHPHALTLKARTKLLKRFDPLAFTLGTKRE